MTPFITNISQTEAKLSSEKYIAVFENTTGKKYICINEGIWRLKSRRTPFPTFAQMDHLCKFGEDRTINNLDTKSAPKTLNQSRTNTDAEEMRVA